MSQQRQGQIVMRVPADLVEIQKNYFAVWKPLPRPWHSNKELQAEIAATLREAKERN
jgi:hypothetical protein